MKPGTNYLFVGRHAFVICIGYVVFAENLLTGVAFHWKKIYDDKKGFEHQVRLRLNKEKTAGHAEPSQTVL